MDFELPRSFFNSRVRSVSITFYMQISRLKYNNNQKYARVQIHYDSKIVELSPTSITSQIQCKFDYCCPGDITRRLTDSPSTSSQHLRLVIHGGTFKRYFEVPDLRRIKPVALHFHFRSYNVLSGERQFQNYCSSWEKQDS